LPLCSKDYIIDNPDKRWICSTGDDKHDIGNDEKELYCRSKNYDQCPIFKKHAVVKG